MNDKFNGDLPPPPAYEMPEDIWRYTAESTQPPGMQPDSWIYSDESIPLNMQPSYERGRIALIGEEWKFTRSGNYVVTLENGVEAMKDPAFKAGVENILGHLQEGEHYLSTHGQRDITFSMPSMHYKHFMENQILNTNFLVRDESFDYSSFLKPKASAKPAIIPSSPTDLLERRMHKLMLEMPQSAWGREDDEIGGTTYKTEIPMRGDLYAHQNAAERVIAGLYPARKGEVDYQNVSHAPGKIIIEIDEDRFKRLTEDALKFQRDKSNHRR